MLHDLIIRDPEPGPAGHVEIAIAGGQISEINPRAGAGTRATLNASGLQILPGVIDAHVHFNEPGRTHWEGFATGSRAAVAGGTTTVFDMPLNSDPPLLDAAAFEAKRRAVEGISRVDFGLWGGLTPLNIERIDELVAAGVIGFKAFMSPSGIDEFPYSNVATLRAGMRRIVDSGSGLRLALHAEDPAQLAAPRPDLHPLSHAARPPAAEVSAIRIAAELAGETGCPITIVHVSCTEALDAVLAARAAGVDITCETCPHYLHLNETDAERPGLLGAAARCAPPLRPEALRAALLARRSEIDTIGSDHSPCPVEMKEGAQPWGGVQSVQQLLQLALAAAGDDGAARADVLRQLTARPAEIFGLRDKGRLEPGADADLVLFDPQARPSLRAEDLHCRHPHSPYLGRDLRGVVRRTLLRGRTVFAHETFGAPGKHGVFGDPNKAESPWVPSAPAGRLVRREG